ncbi:gas vesicle protein GvpG [Kitasatospora sp. NPDC051914]|uniref:gas vesicle protein GvpG n=1 Tax=Kitasatospora sp. NPDC051914 TaxID=3154945 RepID=UPI00342CC180
MGLITGLLTLPLAPVRGVVWVAERVAEAAEQKFYDPAPVEEALKALERDLVAGRIDEATFEQHEEELLDRLDEIRRYWASRGR